MVSLLVVADILLYREGLCDALDSRGELEIVGTAASGEAAAASLAELQPDVILVDVAAADGLTIVRSVVESVPDAKVVALALPDSDADVIAFAEAGAAGYVPRDGTLADLEAVIMTVARGEALVPPRTAASLFRRLANLAADRSRTETDVHLTSREEEIVGLIDEGLSNKEIAQRLSIAVSTVKNHVHSILEKLQVDRRGEAVALLRGRHQRARSGTPPDRRYAAR
jgi:DNA-binding NarL/FixJ family response regulator